MTWNVLNTASYTWRMILNVQKYMHSNQLNVLRIECLHYKKGEIISPFLILVILEKQHDLSNNLWNEQVIATVKKIS